MGKSKAEETIIAHGVRLEGDFESQGDVLIEGEVNGNVKTAGDLRVGQSSMIAADVIANNAVISGQVRGNLQIEGRLELTESASILGNVSCDVLSVAAGAKVNGSLTMDGRGIQMPVAEQEEEEEVV